MKWCRFEAGQGPRYGTVEDDKVTEVSGSPFETFRLTSTTYPLNEVKLLVPVIPPTFYAAGINYPEHVAWAAQRAGTQPNIPSKPESTEGGRRVSVLKRQEGAPVLLG